MKQSLLRVSILDEAQSGQYLPHKNFLKSRSLKNIWGTSMLALYGLICTAVFCLCLKAFWKELLSLHELLLQNSFQRYFMAHAKGQVSSSPQTNLFPKTWRSTWLRLAFQSPNLDSLKDLAKKSGLLSFCLSSTSGNPRSMIENFQVLAILDLPEEAFAVLQRIPLSSGTWLEELHTESLKSELISIVVVKNLIELKRFEAAKKILNQKPADVCTRLLVDLVSCSHEARAVAFTLAAEKDLSIQLEFISEIIKTESFEIALLKYRLRFSPEVRALIDASMASSHWWLAHALLPLSSTKQKPVFSLDWYFTTQEAPEETIIPVQNIETILIAG